MSANRGTLGYPYYVILSTQEIRCKYGLPSVPQMSYAACFGMYPGAPPPVYVQRSVIIKKRNSSL